jgi:multidrug efflux system membrane fusion protein
MRRTVVWLAVLAALGGGAWLIYARTAPDTEAARRSFGQPVPVVVATAARRDVPVYLDGLGTVQAFNAVTVRAMIDGPLSDVDFTEGQDVAAGAVLAHIDPRPYQASLDQAIAKKAQDEATLANARLDLARYTKLVATNYTSAQTADTQRAAVAQDEAIVAQDQASIDSARTQLSYTTITAPLAGRTGIRQVDAGNIVHTTDTSGLVLITQLQPISVVFTLPQQALPRVAAAMQAGGAVVLALAQGSGGDAPSGDVVAGPGLAATTPGAEEATAPEAAPGVLDRGTLAVLDNQVDTSTGTIRLKATFPNPRLTLWPGGFVNVRLRVQTLHDVITVPPVAVQRGPADDYVYVARADNTVSRRAVVPAHEDERLSVIASGLAAGERVVVEGASRLSDGAKVSIAAPDTDAAPLPPPRERRHTPAGPAESRASDGRGT